jgi:hypothetical protein
MKKIKQHKDKYFLYHQHRYNYAGFILDCNSWDELLKKIETYNTPIKKRLYDEYKLFNLTILVEYELSTILELGSCLANLDKLFKNNF